ncbi:MAG: hypothetical protein PWQ74_1031 [Methanobacteriaceae archaeon]|nr:MAG: hypothetical protein XD44_0294 [Methanobacteriaceae archaeon 41_258]MDI3484444.1 hypothetical protein [Methanobacteriaceae archaeon]
MIGLIYFIKISWLVRKMESKYILLVLAITAGMVYYLREQPPRKRHRKHQHPPKKIQYNQTTTTPPLEIISAEEARHGRESRRIWEY